jgi:hypothetical protein
MADNWEYHQDERDKAAAIGGLIIIGGFLLGLLGFAAAIALAIMQV